MNEKIVFLKEEELQNAMIHDDMVQSEQLLDDKLLFLNHFGALVSKTGDIEAHKQGSIKILDIELLNRSISLFDSFAVVVSEVEVKVSIEGQEQTDHLKYMRIWHESAGEVKMCAGSAVQVINS